jgi:hypothetical protein
VPVAIREPGLGRSVYQTSYTAMCELLRRVLGDTVEPAPGTTGGIGSVACRATAGLYALLMDHPINRRGRCRSCRRSGALRRRPRRCRVYITADYWLHQPDEALLLRLLAQELGLVAAPGQLPANDRDDTDVLPRFEPDPGDPRNQPLQTPAAPPTPTAAVERPDQDHGGAGDDPNGLRSRRVPPEDPQPQHLGGSPLLTGGMTWPS